MIAAVYGPYVFSLECLPDAVSPASGAPFVMDTKRPVNRAVAIRGFTRNRPELSNPARAQWDGEGISILGRGVFGFVHREGADFSMAPWLMADSSGLSFLVSCCGIGWTLLEGGLAMHASGVVTPRGIELFSAASGVGKSTAAHRLCPPHALFTEDQVLLRPKEGLWEACSPVPGGPPAGMLASIHFLERGQRTTLRRYSRTDALEKILRNTLLWDETVGIHQRLMDPATSLASGVSCSKLQVHLSDFTPASLEGSW